MKISFNLNGKAVEWYCDVSESLREVLQRKGIVSVRDGCNGEGTCGQCGILFNGKMSNSCQILAAQADGQKVVTVDFYKSEPKIAIIQQALIDASCVQCGYCIPAVILSIYELLQKTLDPSDEEIKDALSGTMCRCTGYEQFYDAVNIASKRIKDPNYVAPKGPQFNPEYKHVGKDKDKIDALSLARGERAFVEDKLDSDTCYLKLLMSPYAHAWVKKIDTSKALKLPGVIDIVTHENCPDIVYTTAGQGFPEPSPHDQRMFPHKVRHVGDRVAAVLAETEEQAEAALNAIEVEYEELEPVLSITDAKKEGAPIVHNGKVNYVVGEAPKGTSTEGDSREEPIIYQFPLHSDPHRNIAASVADGIGDIEKGFKEADVIIEHKYTGTRIQCTPLEPHVVFAKMDNGRLVIHASTQVPWHVRRIVSRACGLSENKVRVIKEKVGGGFGAKQDIVLEDLAGFMAYRNNRPVYFRYTRQMEFITSRTRHGMEITVKLGAKKDGKLTAVDMLVEADTGPYGQHCLTVPMNAVSKSLPLILCDNMHFAVKTYYTNLSPAGAYQGYGAPKGSFALQTALAELADKLGMDQLDLLDKNRIHSGSRLDILKSLGEGRPGAVVTLGKCGLTEMINKGRKAFNWDAAKRVLEDDDWKIGKSAVIIQQGSGLPGIDAGNAEVRLLSDGTLMMLYGGTDLGTGLDTIAAKSAAEILCIDLQDVSVVAADTDTTPFDCGAYASSGTFFSGGAAVKASQDLKAKCMKLASEILNEAEEELELVYPGTIKGKNGQVTLKELGHMSTQGTGFGEVVGFGTFKTDHAAIPYGAHFAEVAVNKRTGQVKVLRFHAYQDCGTPINPALAKGQIFGGIMKAIGHSLYEEMLFDEKGVPLNVGFQDYKVPSIYEVPDDFYVELVPVEDEVGPFGGKSVSEISLNSAAPAIAIAIHDAVGVWCRTYPFTPERILKELGKC